MGNVSRIEPDDCILVDSDDALRQKLQKVGWLNFIKKFHGYNLEVAKQFAATFDGKTAVVGNLELQVTKQSIAEATGLMDEGEEWFKIG